VEEYQPSDLSEEEALQLAIEESELVELGNWEGLRAQLAASASSNGAGASSSGAGASTSRALPPPPPPAPEPQPWGYAVWESPPRAPPIQVNWGALGLHRAPAASPAAAAAGSGASSPRGADGALVVSLGPAAIHRPHQGQ
jgi:hypothetical protein